MDGIVERKHEKYDRLIANAQQASPPKTAVVHPCDQHALESAIDAARLGLIAPILVGPLERIGEVAADLKLDISDLPIVSTEHSHASAARAVELVREGKAEALMKGSLHTDELMSAVVKSDGGLRTSRRLSHCFVMDVPGHTDPLIITDAAVDIVPTLADKVDILQNAIDFAHVPGIPEVRVAILSAVETVNPKIPSTIEAGALCKMADRGQITGAIVDGPLAFDNAVEPGGGGDQAPDVACRRPCQRHPGARSRSGQHARQKLDLHGARRCGRNCAGELLVHHLTQSGGQRSGPTGLLRRRLAGRRQPTSRCPQGSGLSHFE